MSVCIQYADVHSATTPPFQDIAQSATAKSFTKAMLLGGQYSTVTVQYSTVQYSTVTVQYSPRARSCEPPAARSLPAHLLCMCTDDAWQLHADVRSMPVPQPPAGRLIKTKSTGHGQCRSSIQRTTNGTPTTHQTQTPTHPTPKALRCPMWAWTCHGRRLMTANRRSKLWGGLTTRRGTMRRSFLRWGSTVLTSRTCTRKSLSTRARSPSRRRTTTYQPVATATSQLFCPPRTTTNATTKHPPLLQPTAHVRLVECVCLVSS